MEVNESECTFTHEGRSFTNRGAFVQPGCNYALVYVDGTGAFATTWNGEKIGRITYERPTRAGFGTWGKHVTLYSYGVVMLDGSRWYGRGPGRQMYLRLRRCKGG